MLKVSDSPCGGSTTSVRYYRIFGASSAHLSTMMHSGVESPQVGLSGSGSPHRNVFLRRSTANPTYIISHFYKKVKRFVSKSAKIKNIFKKANKTLDKIEKV